MELTRDSLKPLVTFLIILILFEVVIVWYLIQQFHENYLSGDDALGFALADANLSEDAVDGIDIKLKHKSGEAWYNIEFDAGDPAVSYSYQVNAETGEILSAEIG